MSDRTERETYRGDVHYEEWRRGLPEGALSDDRINQAYDDGVDADHLVQAEAGRRSELQCQRDAEEWAEIEFLAQVERDHYENEIEP